MIGLLELATTDLTYSTNYYFKVNRFKITKLKKKKITKNCRIIQKTGCNGVYLDNKWLTCLKPKSWLISIPFSHLVTITSSAQIKEIWKRAVKFMLYSNSTFTFLMCQKCYTIINSLYKKKNPRNTAWS